MLRNTEPGGNRSLNVSKKKPSRPRPQISTQNSRAAKYRHQKTRDEFERRVKYNPTDSDIWLRYSKFEAQCGSGKALAVLKRAAVAAPAPEVFVEMLRYGRDAELPVDILKRYPNSELVRKAVLPYLRDGDAVAYLGEWCKEDLQYVERLIALHKRAKNYSAVSNLYHSWAERAATDTNVWKDALVFEREHGSKEAWYALAATAVNHLFFSKPQPPPSGRLGIISYFLRTCDWPAKDRDELVQTLIGLDLTSQEEAALCKNDYKSRMISKNWLDIHAAITEMRLHMSRVSVVDTVKTFFNPSGFKDFDQDVVCFYFEEMLSQPVPSPATNPAAYLQRAREISMYVAWKKDEKTFNRAMSIYSESRDIRLEYAKYCIVKLRNGPPDSLYRVFGSKPFAMDSLLDLQVIRDSPGKFRGFFYNQLLAYPDDISAWIGLVKLEELCRNIDQCRQLLEMVLESVIDFKNSIESPKQNRNSIWILYLSLERAYGTKESSANILTRWAKEDKGVSSEIWPLIFEYLFDVNGVGGVLQGLDIAQVVTGGMISERDPGPAAQYLAAK